MDLQSGFNGLGKKSNVEPGLRLRKMNRKREKSCFFKTLFSFPLLLSLLIIGALISGAVLINYISGEQSGEIEVEGIDSLVLFDGMSLDNLVIPPDLTYIENGQYLEFNHTIQNVNTVERTIYFSVNDSWFNDTNHTYYGFTMGIKNDGGVPISNLTIQPGENKTIAFWYETDKYMVGATVTTEILIY